ncbi:MAG: heparinase II/III family protein [Phycisphaerae bacterium]|nr:heparinase II/III family protein [Phycisphaerae bacterium]
MARIRGWLPALATMTTPLIAAEHPSIFLSPEDVPALRRKAGHPEMKRFTDALLARCEYLLTAEPIRPPAKASTANDRSGGELHKARSAQGRVLALAMGYLITGKKAYVDRALSELWCFADVWNSWVDPYHGDPRFYDLMSGEMCMTAGIAYDWLYHAMTESQRARLRKITIDRGLSLHLFHTDFAKNGKQARGWWFRCHHNWNTVCNGGAVIAALALRGEYEPWEEVVRQAKSSWMRFFNHLTDEGGWDEGTGYWRYGMRYAVMGVEALRNVTGEGQDIFDRPGMRRTGWFPINFNPGGVPVSFGDAAGVGADPILYLLGAKYKEPAFIWYQDTYGTIPDVKKEGWPVESLAILWRPVDKPWQLRPGEAPKLPTASAYPDIGWAVFADALPKPSVICGFKCGDLGANHTQLDNNVCNVWAYGKWLAIDLGSGSYTREYFSSKRWSLYEVGTLGHNGVLIGGKGQKPRTKGRLGPLQTGDGYALIAGDATANYGDSNVKLAQRTILFLGRRGIVVVDQVETASPSDLRVCWHNWAEPAMTDDGASLRSGNVCLDVAAWSPRPLEWSKAFDVGKGFKSRNVRADWLARATCEAGTSHLVVSRLHPRRSTDKPVQRIQASGAGAQLELVIDGAKRELIRAEIGYRVRE